ncbi:MAG: dTDP-glucose 4,6-dehydratase [Candidatus Omnitrophota bacterium]
MKLLVTGGAGFIGSNFIRYILDKYPDYKVVNLDNLSYCGNLENLRSIEKNPNYKFIKGDICIAKIVEMSLNDVDVVINMAAETHVDRSIVDAFSFIQTNVVGTYTLLEAAKRKKVKLFLQVSTDEVYGSIENGSFKEVDPLNPSSPYAASKASADLLARSYFTTYNFPVVISRSSNNFGPYQYPEKVIPLFITNILEAKKVPLYGDGLNRRDWIFVLDNCAAIDLVIHKGLIGEIYNICSGNEFTNRELTDTILAKMGKGEDTIEYVLDRPGHDRRYSVDPSKIRSLGWQPSYDFNSQLALTISWYKDNQKWWQRLKRS